MYAFGGLYFTLPCALWWIATSYRIHGGGRASLRREVADTISSCVGVRVASPGHPVAAHPKLEVCGDGPRPRDSSTEQGVHGADTTVFFTSPGHSIVSTPPYSPPELVRGARANTCIHEVKARGSSGQSCHALNSSGPTAYATGVKGHKLAAQQPVLCDRSYASQWGRQ